METLQYSKQVPVTKTGDVIVVGGGPTGIAAAIAAARNGARTILVERYGFLGGTATAGLVGPFMTSYDDTGEVQIVRGIFDELMRRLETVGGGIHPAKTSPGTAHSSYLSFGHKHVAPFSPEALKLVAAEMCLEAGVDLLFHSMFLDPIMDGNAVAGVIVANKSGLQALKAKVTVDASGDADVAFAAGAPTVKGRELDGKMQPVSLFFRIGNVEREKVEAYRREHPEDSRLFESIIEQARERGEYPIPRQGISPWLEPDGFTWRLNQTRILGIDGTSVEDLTRAEIEGRRQVAFLIDFFRKNLPGFENCVFIDTAPQVGIRETRRIVGEYVLKLEDLQEGKVFADAVAFAAFPVDIHQVDGIGGTHLGYGPRGKFPIADMYSIPYHSLVPLQIDGLLVAGRTLSATHEAAASARVMPFCFATGEAAGVASALAVKQGMQPRQVDGIAVRRALANQGAYVGPLEALKAPVPLAKKAQS
ncbi:MAG: FAD-dependent oxidoreductase [Dehalococcoidales bacterium]|nr:FAD-dependent oxidoreductase [Dehalococcoidales bacterium]